MDRNAIFWSVFWSIAAAAIWDTLKHAAPYGLSELVQRVMRIIVKTIAISAGVLIAAWAARPLLTHYHPDPPSRPVVVKFVANPKQVAPGSSCLLEWSVTDATDIVIDQGVGKVAAASSVVVKPQASTIYSLTAAGPGGKVLANVAIEVAPSRPPAVVTFVANPPSIDPGSAAQLRWEVTDATDVVIDPGVGKVAATGMLEVKPMTSTSYVLTAIGPGGRASTPAVVNVSSEARPAPVAATLSVVTPAPLVVPPPSQVITQTYLRQVDVPLQHRYVGSRAKGTLTVTSKGIKWRQDDGRNSFDEKPCSVVTIGKNGFDPYKLSLDLKIDGKPYEFFADSKQHFDAANIAFDSLCYPSAEVWRYSSPFGNVRLSSQDKGDSLRIKLATRRPWAASLAVDVNKNGSVDSSDQEYSHVGRNEVMCHILDGKRVCNNSGRTVDTRDNGEESEVSFTIPKQELSTKEPFAVMYLWIYNLQVKNQQDQWSPAITIPFEIHFTE
jgi:hypothetical protein